MVLAMAAGCTAEHANHINETAAPRIVSLDFCADQFVLKFADRSLIAAVSPDAEKSFSYMRAQAKGVPKVRPRAEDVLLMRPDIVVRSYGGGPNAATFFERAGIKVVQINYANDIAGIRQNILHVANALGAPQRGKDVAAAMDARLAAIETPTHAPKTLYLTSKGASAGNGTLIGEIFERAQLENFQTVTGWTTTPLERLAYEAPDVIAAGFFETNDLTADIWSAARHPLAQRRVAEIPRIDLPGAWTACAGWFIADAVEALAQSTTP